MRLFLTAFAAAFVGLASVSASAVHALELPRDLRIGPGTLVVSKQEMMCLALNDYWEARSESLPGRVAVAQVVLNRAKDPRFPNTICDVVQENRSGQRHKCQFSWYCDGLSDTPYEKDAWRSSVLLAVSLLRRDNAINDPTEGALWYHNSSVRPSWARKLESTVTIGTHHFYTDETTPTPSATAVADTRAASKKPTATTSTMPTTVPSTFADWIDNGEDEQVAGQ